MKLSCKIRLWSILAIALLWSAPEKAFGQADSATKESTAQQAVKEQKGKATGKRCLFIGHSFFIPVAAAFKKQCRECGIDDHSQEMIFAGGIKGSPGRLWQNEKKRAEIQKILDGGKVELLGMTYFSPDNSSLKDYKRWIDYALSKNPKTDFFIGLPWGLNGPESSIAAFATTNSVGQAVVYKGIVEQLRKDYPRNRFYWANYGKVVVELKRAFESGRLPNIQKMVDRNGRSSLFRDLMGHASPYTLEITSLVWLSVLYDTDPPKTQFKGKGGDKIKEIIEKISTKEKSFNQK